MPGQHIGTGRSYAPYHGEGLPLANAPRVVDTNGILAAVIAGLTDVMSDLQYHGAVKDRYTARIEKLQSLAKALRGE